MNIKEKEILEIIEEHWRKNDMENAHELKDKIGKCYSKVNQGQRKKNDLYETPFCLTSKLLGKETFHRSKYTLEPACGKSNAIVKVLLNYDFTELEWFDICYNMYSGNFLDRNIKCDYIITNPPYSIADKFILKAKEITKIKFAFLLKLDFLSGQKRYKTKIYDELKKVYIFNRMPNLNYPIRADGLIQATGMQTYAWFIWEKGYEGKPEIDWLDISDCIVRKQHRRTKQEVEADDKR